MKDRIKQALIYVIYNVNVTKGNNRYKLIPYLDDRQNSDGLLTVKQFSDFSEYKLILHPLSDLIKEIEFKGEKIIPIVELAKEFHKSEYEVTSYEIVDNFRVKCFVENSKDRYMYFDIDPEILNNKYKIVEKLKKWLFDVYKLIASGDAVDINT